MKKKKEQDYQGSGNFRYIKRKDFMAGDTHLIVEDWINLAHPSQSRRILWIAGTNALYSEVPLSPSQHELLCYNYCDDILKKKKPSFYHHALVLGCGGGAIPRWLLQEYTGVTVDVVDFSPEIIDVCKEYFLTDWVDSGRLNFYCMDAKDFEQQRYKYEFIFCDLFDGENLAPFVYTEDFAKKLCSMVTDDGFVSINCGWGHVNDVLETYEDVFKYQEVVRRDSWQTQALTVSKSPIL